MAYLKPEDPMKSSKLVEAWYPKIDGIEGGMYEHAALNGKTFSMLLVPMLPKNIFMPYFLENRFIKSLMLLKI